MAPTDWQAEDIDSKTIKISEEEETQEYMAEVIQVTILQHPYTTYVAS